jgi:hypothetical protein
MKLTIELRTVFIASAAALAALTGVAYATIPGGDGVIVGCYKNSGSNLRVIDAAVDTCGPNETALPWSQTGPQGTSGAPGEPGAPGISGYEIVSNSVVRESGFGVGGGFVNCPAGKVPLGGGAGVSDPEDDDGSFFSAGQVTMDFPFSEGGVSGWKANFVRVVVPNQSPPFTTTVYAVCAFVDG